jgi:hypothetical protein
MSSYEQMKQHRKSELENSIKMLERLAEANQQRVHFLSQESYKLGLKFAIREIEGTEMLFIKAHRERPYANPIEAEREHKNLMNVLMMLKKSLIDRYEGRP